MMTVARGTVKAAPAVTTMYHVGYADRMAAVRRPALLLLLAVVVAGPACATRGAVPRPFPGAALPPGAPPVIATQPTPIESVPAPSDPALIPPAQVDTTPPPATVLSTALALMGIPYRNGGSEPTGFDCSGLVQWVFARHGARLPREVRDQYHAGEEIPRDALQPGDLVFFSTVSRGASHVGIVVNEREFVHAPSSRGVVRLERFAAAYWARRFVGARRVLLTASGTPAD